MPKAVIACLAPGLKHILGFEAKHIVDVKEHAAFLEILEGIPDCENGGLFQLEVEGSSNNPGKREKREKRAPSAYNKFVGKCTKEGKGMKECATTWKRMDQAAKAKF